MRNQATLSPPKSEISSEHKNISSCPKCNSSKTVKKGFRSTKHRGKIQRFICRKCKHSFVIDDGFWKMKNNPKRIIQAIDTYFEGLSLRKIKRNFSKYAETEISHQTVINWLHKYIYLIRNNVKKLKPQLSGHYLTDETIIRCAGEKHNFGLVMDKDTRYVVATRYSEKEAINPQDNIALWKESQRIKRPYKLTSDAHPTYKEAFKKVFYTRYKKDKVQWNVINHQKTGQYNYTMERIWNTLKERIKIMRSFKAPWSAKLLIDGFFIWYNFIRPHMGLKNNTPSTLAKAHLELNKLICFEESVAKVFK